MRGLSSFVDLSTGEIMGRSDFQARNCDIIPAGSRGEKSADNVFLNSGGQQVVTATYRPGAPVVCRTAYDAGVVVDAVNMWRASALVPVPATDQNIRIWLDHIELLISELPERTAFLDKMAFITSEPGRQDQLRDGAGRRAWDR